MTEINVTECPECGKTGKRDGRILLNGRGVYWCPDNHAWQDSDEKPTTKAYTPIGDRPREPF